MTTEIFDHYQKEIIGKNEYRLKLMSDIELMGNASVIYDSKGNVSELYNLESGLFGSTKSGACKICNQTKNCPGHFGVIPLIYPIITNSVVEDKFLRLITNICPICSNFPLIDAKKSLNLKPEERFDWIQKEVKKMKENNVNLCPYCKNQFIFISIDGSYPTIKYIIYQEISNKTIQLNPLLIYAILNNISDQTCEYGGFNVETFNPRNFMTKCITIIPNKLRLKTMENMSASITSQYKTIIEKILPELEIFYRSTISNKRTIEDSENSRRFNTEYFKLNAIYRLYLDMTKDSVTNACLNCLNKHDKKHIDQSASMMGRFRDKHSSYFHKGIVATRHNNSTRTVLGGAPELSVNEIGFPQKYCNKLGFYIPVYKENLELIKQLVAKMSETTKNNKSDVRVIRILKTKYNETNKIKQNRALVMASQIVPGDKIYISMLPGTLVMYNRFPSIREESCSSFEIIPTNHTTMTIPLSICGMKSADFDGDETQIYAPSSWYTDAESLLLHSVYRVCRQYKDGSMLVYFSADAPFEINKINKNTYLGIKEIRDPISNVVIDRVAFNPPKLVLEIVDEYLDEITGHKNNNSLHSFSKINKINYKDSKLVIKENKIDRDLCQLNNQNFYLYLCSVIGEQRTLKLIDNIVQLAYNISHYNPITFGNEIRIYDDEVNEKIRDIQNNTYQKMKIIEQSNLSEDEKNLKQFLTVESQKAPIIKELIESGKGTNLDKMGFLKKYQSEYYSSLVNMDPAIINGERIQSTLADYSRTCISFPKYSIDPCAYGYIKHGYSSAFISPVDTFYDCMVQRKALYDKGVSIGKQGYSAKRYNMAYGPSIVDGNGAVTSFDTLISFTYGNSSLDPRLSHDLPLFDLNMDEKEFNEKYDDPNLIHLRDKILEVRKRYGVMTNQTKINVLNDYFVGGFDYEQYLIHNSVEGKTEQKIIDELCEKIKEVFSPKKMIQRYNLLNLIQFEYYLRTKLKTVKITREIAIEIYYYFINSLIFTGETVGLKASLAISEAFTQDGLNAIHKASGGSINIDRVQRSSGLVRFEELLGGSIHKHNVVTFGFYENTKEFATKFANKHETIYFKNIWNKLEMKMSNKINSKIIQLHDDIDFSLYSFSKLHIQLILNLNILGDFEIKLSEVFNKIIENYPKISFISGYVVNKSEFLTYIYFKPDTRKIEIDEYIRQWKSEINENVIHGQYLKNCFVTQNVNSGDWLVIANEIVNDSQNIFGELIFDPDVDPSKCKTTDTKYNLDLYGVFEASARLCEELIYCGTNLTATKSILARHYKTICESALSNGKYLLAASNSIGKHDGDYLRKINFEIASMFIRKAIEKGEFIENTDMISAQTFNDLPKLGSGYSKITLFKK